MNSELDRQDLLANQDNPEFEQFLDSWYAQREEEWAEMQIAKLEMEWQGDSALQWGYES